MIVAQLGLAHLRLVRAQLSSASFSVLDAQLAHPHLRPSLVDWWVLCPFAFP